LTNLSEIESVVAQVTHDLGPIDILVNNAAAFHPGGLNLKDSQMEEMWRTNVGGPVHLVRLVAEGMKERKFGRIINITSAAAFGTSVEGTTFYAATKAALGILTRRFAMELGPYGITVNAVCPGFVPTEQTMSGRVENNAQEFIEFFAHRAMVGRVGSPEDIAYAVAFLASREASFITAQILTVDGGRMDYIGHA
jgi:3-oxoacyl-[acyl-carrier protein] reductase